MRNYIPTINISSLLKSDFNTLTAKNTIKKIEKACVNVGFFQIVGHGINKEKINIFSMTYVNRLSDLFFVLSRVENGNGKK